MDIGGRSKYFWYFVIKDDNDWRAIALLGKIFNLASKAVGFCLTVIHILFRQQIVIHG